MIFYDQTIDIADATASLKIAEIQYFLKKCASNKMDVHATISSLFFGLGAQVVQSEDILFGSVTCVIAFVRSINNAHF